MYVNLWMNPPTKTVLYVDHGQKAVATANATANASSIPHDPTISQKISLDLGKLNYNDITATEPWNCLELQ